MDYMLERSRSLKQKSQVFRLGFLNVAPPAGLEPATYGLTVRRSTN